MQGGGAPRASLSPGSMGFSSRSNGDVSYKERPKKLFCHTLGEDNGASGPVSMLYEELRCPRPVGRHTGSLQGAQRTQTY